jgi:hypothetical protein
VPDPTIQFGILKCRDLVQLFYGVRLVASILEQDNQLTTGQTGPLIAQDPRRIRYEIIMGNYDTAYLYVGIAETLDELTAAAGPPQTYVVPPASTIIVERNWITDLDAVTLPLFVQPIGTSFVISTRETFLTPAPIDEGP